MALACAIAAACPSESKRDLSTLDPLAVQAHTLLTERRFAELDKLAVTLRAKDMKSTSPYQSSYWFYAGLTLDSPGYNCGIRAATNPWEPELALIKDWVRASPNSAAARITLARYQHALAWIARGPGFAGQVSEEQWTGFRAGIDEAVATMATIKLPSEREPEYYFVMIPLAMEANWGRKRFAATHDEAFQRFPYLVNLYSDSARYYKAKWGGSQQEYDAFIEKAVRSTKTIMGDGMYAQIHFAHRDSAMFSDGRVSWPRMHAAFQRIASDFPGPRVHNRHASMACQAGDVTTLKEELAIIKDKIAPEIFGGADYVKACEQLAQGLKCFLMADTQEKVCIPSDQIKTRPPE